ncbi:MAG: patatin-like phospholipase family protein, partial [Vicinamibacteria bacterium]
IQVGDAYYGDGGIRHASPLAPAIHLGADRVLTISARYPRTQEEESEKQVVGYPPPAQILGMLMHGVFLDALENDAERIARINRTLALLPPGTRHPEGLRPIRLLVLRPSRDLGKLSASLAHHLPRPLRIIVRGLGAYQTSSPDFLSYLLFERPYISRLIEVGYEDAHQQWDEIARFLES